jgi:RimJ/RimL family protein N-acetyltransferase
VAVWLKTERLLIRTWIESDKPPMAAINRDPENNRYFTRMLDQQQTIDFIDEQNAHYAQDKIGLLAVERKEDRQFMGYCGLSVPKFEAHFTPCVEIAWKLDRRFWEKGYATEAARAVLAYGFTELKLKEIVALTAGINLASRAVMTKIGMHRDPRDDYKHPKLDENDPLSDLVLYRIHQKQHMDALLPSITL